MNRYIVEHVCTFVSQHTSYTTSWVLLFHIIVIRSILGKRPDCKLKLASIIIHLEHVVCRMLRTVIENVEQYRTLPGRSGSCRSNIGIGDEIVGSFLLVLNPMAIYAIGNMLCNLISE